MSKYASKGVEINGLKKIVREIERLGVSVDDMKAVFQRIGVKVLSTANSGTPVRSGALLASNRVSKRKNAIFLSSGSAKANYARYVSYGTEFQSAQPYLQRVVKVDGPWAAKQLESELGTLIKKAGLK